MIESIVFSKQRAKLPMALEELESYFPDVPHDDKYVYGNVIGDQLVGNLINADEDGLVFDWWLKIDPETVDDFLGFTDIDGRPLYDNDVIQPLRVVNFVMPDGMPHQTRDNDGDEFIAKKANTVYGKWVAEKVNDEGFGVKNYVFNRSFKING